MSKKVKVKFLKSPTGKYGLAYYEGDEVMIDGPLAKSMVKDKTALIIESKAAEKKAAETTKNETKTEK